MEKVILVTEVETPVRFWGQVAKETVAHSLSTASEELQYYCPTGLRVADNSHQKNKVCFFQVLNGYFVANELMEKSHCGLNFE